QRLAHFGAGERSAEAVVHAAAEEQRRDLTGGGDVEGVAAGDGPRIVVWGIHTYQDDGAGGGVEGGVVGGLGGGPGDGVGHRAPPHGLFDGLRGQFGVLPQQGPLVRVLGEGDHGVRELLASGVVRGEYQRHQQVAQVVPADPAFGLLDGHQGGDEVGARCCLLGGHQRLDVLG